MYTDKVVLLAEDDVVVRHLIQLVLVRASYTVLAAADGGEALELSRRYDGEIHLLLSDITMPKMSGVVLAGVLKEERPKMRALLISGNTSSEIARENMCFDFLRKPFRPTELIRRIEELLSTPAQDG